MDRVNHKDGIYFARLGIARREAIRQLAALEGVPMAVVVQRAIDTELAKNAGRSLVIAAPAKPGHE
jgi:hypothetical protein